MFRGNLFWRFFSAIMAAMLIAVFICVGIMATNLSQVRRRAYETEVSLQAREVAEYMGNLNKLSSVVDNVTMQHVIRSKVRDIHDRYNADIWIVSYNSGYAQVLDSSWNTSDYILTDSVTKQLQRIQQGDEIRVTGLFPELGDHIVTIGVPWTYFDGSVVGAVLLHISDEALRLHVTDLLPQVLPAAGIAILLGVIVSLILTRSFIRPLRELDNAVAEFTKGDLSRRVNLNCGGELEQLGHSINNMAQELSELEDSRRHFVAAVSHELRSPLTSMRGYVEALQDGVIPEDQAPATLQIIMDETNRLTDLVRDLLDMSRLESGKFPLVIAPFDANELFSRILISFEPRIDAKHINVEVGFGEEHCYAKGDANRITQVLSNFIDNAIKFMPDGGTLTVETKPQGRDIFFAVRNNGPAIAEKDLPHIFERFYKADKAHTSGGGTGLGLAISNMIVREHGGQIRVESNEALTSFMFTLPACTKAEYDAAAKA
ncbi:MAG: cell wall metabolism sensor histidine kinase WalK [Clostridiales bacterium]|nr:cell wall metabolism sensor histidine kinase WalK [Clostridiales bacterium]